MLGFAIGSSTTLALAVESHTDLIAKELGFDPAEFRLKNLMGEDEENALGKRLSGVKARETLNAALDAAQWKKPKPWPSAEARERVMDLGAHTHGSPHPSSYGALIRKVMAGCKCLVDCDQISKDRVKMIILPLLIKKGGASPCRFIAVED
ncbi:MAG: hypothetical protein A3G40_06220 [Deltaproteobacteria bacterium RIFCSPLOWO2_12_FULL_57_22]|nr:MAG: hypothetical protein A3G40_06220 [Deltaproteobacteria bacterium RIFCSPLOWO2_12_FULL_57_22]